MKWIECGIKQAYDTFVEKSFVFELKEETTDMILDEMRIVLGPYLVGILMAFCVFVLENTDFSNSNSEERAKLEANYEMNEKRRKPFSKFEKKLYLLSDENSSIHLIIDKYPYIRQNKR